MHARTISILLASICVFGTTSTEAALPVVETVDWQPFSAQVKRLLEATDNMGIPLPADTKSKVEAALAETDGKAAIMKIQELLDPQCLFGVTINPEMRVKVAQGTAKPELTEQGWRTFLVKVHNESGTTAQLKVESPNAKSLSGSPQSDVAQRWLDLAPVDSAPLKKTLSGLPLEYRLVQFFSRDAGKREAKIAFNVGQGTQDLGFRSEADVLFDCLPAHPVTLRVRDEAGEPTTASFVIKDSRGRVYPPQTKRLAPDFSFHPQIYRQDGESVRLPAGKYTVEFSRGPESLSKTTSFTVGDSATELSFKAERWIDPSKDGWWSGDHHIHAAGCAHYEKPTEGVLASDMIRQVVGEDLKVGANLTWGPCFDYQKQFFCGTIDKVSQYPYLLRYDIEVSGFGSHNSGHLCLLRLKDQMYPGGDSKKHWPTLCLNTLRWAKAQGALCGPAHSGWGLELKGTNLPNFTVPKFDGIGANEYVMDVTHEVPGPDGKLVPAVDFLSMVDTPYVWELNIWYHTLNAGFRTRISGETDFPCIYGEKVGLGRSYVKLDNKLDYEEWCEGIRQGRNYVSDGKSHLLDFKVNDVAMGERGSELALAKAGTVTVKARVAARLSEKQNKALQQLPYPQKPYWDIERARIDDTRQVPVEVIVNGFPVAKTTIDADGTYKDVSFNVDVKKSSWIALRILPSAHSNPIFVLVDGKPIRASRQSVEWCMKAVDQCWSQKERHIASGELEGAKKDYEHARVVYRKRLEECAE